MAQRRTLAKKNGSEHSKALQNSIRSKKSFSKILPLH